MKKLIFSLAISAFALASVQAADIPTPKAAADKDGACCDSAKSCCASKSACAKGMPSKAALMSPKAAAAGRTDLGSTQVDLIFMTAGQKSGRLLFAPCHTGK